MSNFFSQVANTIYQITGVNGALLFSYGFFAGVLVIFSFTLLVIIYNMALRSN